MKTTLTRLFTVMMLMMVSMTAGADVKVLYGKSGNDTFTGGKISATQEVQKDGQVAVTFTIKPDNGYTFTYTKTSLVIVSVYDPSSQSGTRADEIKVSETLWPKGTEGTISYPNSGEYTVTVDPNLGVWVQKVEFQKKREGEKATVPLYDDFSGYYYIANYTGDTGTSKGYNENTPQTNYYLCPAKPDPSAGDDYFYGAIYYDYDASISNQMPYLTTKRTGRENEALWKIEFAPTNDNSVDYYYIRYYSDSDNNKNKYLTHNTSRAAANANTRYTVHLQTENGDNNSMFCFEPGADGSYFIRPRSVSKGSRHLNPATGNKNYYYGTGANNKKTTINGTTVDPGGMIGYYTHSTHADDQASQWYLEKLPPVISYNSNNLIEISFIDASYTIYYSYGEESTPSESTLNYSETGPFDPPAGTTTIKAIAIKNNIESGVATFTPAFFLGENHKYLIQSLGNGWTTGNFQGNHYYMIPGDVDNNGKTKVNTTSMLRPSMQWYILNAGDNYYYIVNNVANARIRYNSDYGVHLDAWDENSANEFKFQIVKSSTAGTYNIIPYGVTVDAKYLNKASGNAGDGALALHNNAADANSRWKFVPQDTPLADTPPFTPSGASTSVYYKIRNGSGTTFHITPPASADGNATATETTDDVTSWYFIQVEDPTTTDWLAYYKIINARTGKALYYNYVNSTSNCLKVGDYDGSNDDYKFAFVKSTTADYYYIVPKSHKDDQLNKISTFYREGSNIKPATTRAAGNNVWTFIAADLFCNDPEFVEEEGVIKIKCNTNGAKIYINTESNADPTIADVNLYTPTTNENQNWATTTQVRIKAIAIVSDGASPTPNTASSAVITLLNNPNITLSEGGNPVTDETYTYDGTAKEPVVSEVSIGVTTNKTSATATDYETDYSNNTNASTDAVKAKVTLRDKASSILIWHAEKEFKINPKEVGLTWNPVDESDPTKTTFTYSGLAQAPTVTATGVVDTDDCTVTVTVTADQGSSLTNDKAINAGSYTATVSPLENKNYKLPDAKTRTFTITQAPVTVTAENKTKGYGDPEPALTATVSGLVNGENPSLIVYTVSREPGNENGTYAIIPSGAVEQGNYHVTYVNGTLTIDAKKPLNKDDAGTPADGIIIDVTYDGTPYHVVVTHRKVDGDYVLVESTDYTKSVDTNHLEYDVVTVTGCGSNYTGSAKAIYIKLTFYDTTPNAVTDPEETATAYYTTQNLQLSERIEAWYVTSLSNNVLAFKEVKVGEGNDKISYIPANQPVLLFGNSSSTGFMLKPYTGTTMEIPAIGDEANILKVVTEDAGKAVNLGEVYVFSKGEFVLTMAGTLTKGKVYLDNPSYNSSSLSRGTLSASRGETTGIIDVRLSNNQFSEVWYALDGQKYNKKPTRKGIYLQNGKKVVIK